MYEATKGDNEKLGGLSDHMVELDKDFEEMMRIREEARKRLEERFKDVYRYAYCMLIILRCFPQTH